MELILILIMNGANITTLDGITNMNTAKIENPTQNKLSNSNVNKHMVNYK